MEQSTPKSNWIRQLYYYVIIAGALTVFCYGVFTFGRAALIRYVFPKASSSMYSGYNPEMQCAQGGNQYYYPKSMNNYQMMTEQKIMSQPPSPSKDETKECIEATKIGVADEKDRSFQYDAVKGLSLFFVTGTVLAGHYLNRNFFLRKE